MKRVMKTAGCFALALLLSPAPPPSVRAQGETPAAYAGRPAASSNPVVEAAIGESVRRNEPKWKLSAHYESSPGTSHWEWKDGGREVSAVGSYLASEVDAARRVKYTLSGIAVPRYRPVQGPGDEAYLMTADGTALFRAK